ncbi:Major Facilitator Superfamily [Corynebacterium variabile]|uniref:Major Facilitator Superfamily n=1 Tax=Corynebacterium variabile TaxID=1727 RepID=A0A0X2NKB9_9CORY|nr:Major Facilitator Superfamily [Corynebacterium variabile]
MLWTSGLLGNLGANVSIFALPLYVFHVTGSIRVSGITSTLGLICGLLVQVFAGAIVDRRQLGHFLVVLSLLRSVIWVAALGAAWLWDDLWWLLLIAYVIGTGSQSAINAASSAAVRQIVPPDLRSKAIAQNQVRSAAARLIAPPIGASLFIAHPLLPFIAEAVCFSLAAIVAGWLDREAVHRILAPTKATRFLQTVAEGYRYAWSSTFIRAVIVFGLFGNFAIAVVYQSTTLILVDRGSDPFLVSGVGVSIGATTLVFSAAASWLSSRLRRRPLIVMSVSTFSLGAVGLGFIDASPVVAIVGCILVATSVPGLTAYIGGRLSASAPPEMMGRVMAATGLSSGLLAPLAPMFASSVAVPFTPWITVGATVVLFVVGCGFLFFAKPPSHDVGDGNVAE